ncbi:MAG: NusA N-terminal domain-containing protein, partial [Candidatus Dormiibacterota bacterium]
MKSVVEPPSAADSNAHAGELGEVLRTLREDHGVPTAGVVAAVEAAIPAAWSQLEASPPPVRVRLDPETGQLLVEVTRLVVEGEPASASEISLERALQLDPGAELGSPIREPAQLPKAVAARAARLVKAAIGQR